MPFEAIVHAPALRVGARINIAEVDQVEGTRPGCLGIGAELRLRIGCCSPRLVLGRITGLGPEPDTAVLTIGADAWALRRSDRDGVAVPGLLSETWHIIAKSEAAASPVDHSIVHSNPVATSEG